MISRMKRIGQCYICGDLGPDTRDHVIPDCFFIQPRPENLLTLPAHNACNACFSLSDEYARNILAGLAAGPNWKHLMIGPYQFELEGLSTNFMTTVVRSMR